MPTILQPTKAVVAASAIFSAAILSACSVQDAPQPDSDNEVSDPAPPRPLPIVEPPFNRSRLLLTVVRAASAHSTGQEDPNIQRMLNGKQFEVRLRFGCDGQGPGKGDFGWSVDPDGKTLRLRAVPNLSLEDAAAKDVAGDGVEAVEGFWLTRPWLLHAACPARQDSSDGPTGAVEDDAEPEPDAEAGPVAPDLAIPSVGIARFFTPDDARTRRRMNRPFEAVKQLENGEQVGQDGFNLVLSGRLRSRSDGKVILCTGTGRDRPPACIVSAAIDRVWIEKPADRKVMAEWSL